MSDQNENKIPYCCPVCGGKGIVPNSFYTIPFDHSGSVLTSSTTPEPCRSCVNGIIWGINFKTKGEK